MLRPERFSSSPKFSKKKTLKGTSDYWAASCPLARLDEPEILEGNRVTELAFARSRHADRRDRSPSRWLTQQASGDW
jgi:hypothetical protein